MTPMSVYYIHVVSVALDSRLDLECSTLNWEVAMKPSAVALCVTLTFLSAPALGGVRRERSPAPHEIRRILMSFTKHLLSACTVSLGGPAPVESWV